MIIKNQPTRLGGELMIIRPKDTMKLFGIVIMCACATLVCTIFLNSNIDLARVANQITDPNIFMLYEITVSSGNVTSAVTGGALGITTIIMLFFYIKHYIDTHKSELGILKALGYSNIKIAKSFWIFGLSIFLGTAIGYGLSFLFMPMFYRDMRSDILLPDISIHFNPILILYLVILPSLLFSLIAIFYSYYNLKRPALELIRGKSNTKVRKHKKTENQNKEIPFIKSLKQSIVRSRISLVFFIGLAAFCYSATVVMSFSIHEVGGAGMMAIMMACIGIILAVTTLFITVTTVIKSNNKTIAMLRVFGYSDRECYHAVLSGYRPIAYIGFILGAGYQHGLMLMMISLFFDNEIMDLPDYNFNIRAFFIGLISFAVLYELFMRFYSNKMKKIPLKEIMLEE